MPHVAPLRLLWAVLPLCAVGAGCDPDCATVEPAYAGNATDEAWRVMLDAKAGAAASDDVEVVSGLDIDAGATEFTLGFTSTLQVASASPRLPSFPRSRPRRDVVDRVVDGVFSAVLPRAHAHLPPITSDVYLVEVAVAGRACPVAALTTDESVTFSGDDAAAIAGAAGEHSLTVWSAFLTQNRVTEGAFVTGPLTLTVE